MTIVSAKSAIRAVTADEVAFYQEHGWVKLEGLLSTEVAREMLAWAQTERERWNTSTDSDTKSSVRDHGIWTEWRFIASDDRREPFRSVALSPDMGRNVQRLV